MISKGDKICCGGCGKHILTAAEDIPYLAPMESRLLTLPDGTPLAFGAAKICQHCGREYQTIYTSTRATN